MVRQLNPRKLINSKWTAVKPENKEKHFIITKVLFNEDNQVIECHCQAVYSNNTYEINWHDLKDNNIWLQGWQ